ALIGDGATIDGGLFMNEGFQANGCVHLIGANIGGSLECAGASFLNPDNIALNAENMNIGGNVLFDNPNDETESHFRSNGDIDFSSSRIQGDLNCRGAELSSTYYAVLNASEATIQGSVFFCAKEYGKGQSRRFVANGLLDLRQTRIGLC